MILMTRSRRLLPLLLGFATTALLSAATPPPAPARLDRADLLVYRDRQGAMRPVRSVHDWKRRRAEILRGMQDVMGPLPDRSKRCPLEMIVLEETDAGDHVRRLITYQSEPGGRVPAYLLIPKQALTGKGRFPGVLCLHPTHATLGHRMVVGLGPDANRSYALELARRGYVTLAPSYPLLADYQPDLAALGWQSGTLKAVWDNRRGLDLLDSLPYVRHGRYGAIGHSLGGHNAVFTAVFDDRIRAVVSSCGLDSFLDYYGGDPQRWAPEQGWCQTRYMPRLTAYAGRLEDIPFDFHELIAALAPRPVLLSAPLHDSNFQWTSVDRIAAAAASVYRLYRKPDLLRLEHPDCPHDFPEPMRTLAYELFDRVLQP
ncbi:MAG TPA: alpha/beta hydrolase [Verrucomicrobiota bacterium]|nr:alpha/beta hydrolase [Verrucomicrobiota bacterium]